MSKQDELMIQVELNRDSFGVITQPDHDGGDSLNRTALYYGARHILDMAATYGLMKDLSKITTTLPIGRYRRHPDPVRWYSNPDNVTRDQMGPMEATLSLYGLDTYLKEHIVLRLKRMLFHFDTQDQNIDSKFPDPPSPQELCVIGRGLGMWYLYPLYMVLDIMLLVSVFFNLEEGQAILNCAVSKKYPTLFSKLAIWKIKTKATANDEIRSYHSLERNGIIALGELMILAKDAL